MFHMMTMVPPIQRSMMSGGDIAFWVMIGLLIILAFVATALWIVGNRRIEQRRPQVKDAGHEYETLPPLHHEVDERSQVHSRYEEEALLRR